MPQKKPNYDENIVEDSDPCDCLYKEPAILI